MRFARAQLVERFQDMAYAAATELTGGVVHHGA